MVRRKIDKTEVGNEKKKRIWTIAIIIVFLLIAGIVAIGYYGGKQTHSLLSACDIGWDGTMCWKWHQANSLTDILNQLGAKL